MIMNIILDTDTLSIYNSAKLKKLFNKKYMFYAFSRANYTNSASPKLFYYFSKI